MDVLTILLHLQWRNRFACFYAPHPCPTLLSLCTSPSSYNTQIDGYIHTLNPPVQIMYHHPKCFNLLQECFVLSPLSASVSFWFLHPSSTHTDFISSTRKLRKCRIWIFNLEWGPYHTKYIWSFNCLDSKMWHKLTDTLHTICISERSKSN